MSTHIIAEAGTNHGGKLNTAKELIDIAIQSGATSVKFQIIYPEGLYLPRFHSAEGYTENAVFKTRQEMMLSDDDYRELARYAREKGIPMTASVFDQRGVDLLNELDVPYIKIASTDLNNGPLLRYAAQTGRQLVVSTGMSTLGEIDEAVNQVFKTGNENLVLLHCVSVYPAPTEIMNLSFIKTLKAAFGVPVGLSDHTENSLAVAMALVMGIEWVEKHYTYNRKAEGFDHAYAMEPDMFAAYVQDMRASEKALAPSRHKISEKEATTRQRARRALYAARDIPSGTVITEDDVVIVRPVGPLAPNDLDLVIGRTSQRDIQQFEPLSLDIL